MNHRRFITLSLAAVPVAALLAGCQSGVTPGSGDCRDDLDGQIEFVVPYSAGGGFDTWARLIAPGLEEHLDAEPTVIVNNRTGAGGLVGTTEVLAGKPDGHTLVITEPGGLATANIAGLTDTPFAGMLAVGRVTVGPEALVVAADSTYQTVEDLQSKAASDHLLMATNGLAAVQVIAADQLDLPFEAINHEGSSEMLLSLVRGDTDFAILPVTSVAEGIRVGDYRMLTLIGTADETDPDFDVIDGVTTLDDATGQEGLGAALEQHRMILVAPETDPCLVDALSTALGEVFDDPDTVGQAEKMGLRPAYLPAADAQAVFDSTFTSLEDYADLLKEISE